jgi:capsular polysaccharide export protein
MKRIAVLTRGLWRLRREIAALTGMTPVRRDIWPRPSFDAVAGWGQAPTTRRARRLAAKSGVPYIAFEDGPLRSIRPGPEEPPVSLVVDRTGIYYDANHPSDLLALMATRPWFTSELAERAVRGSETLRRLRLSKYNAGPERSPHELGLDAKARRRVLVLDQVHGDASIAGALADGRSFSEMLAAAITENEEAEIVVKLHPDVLSGRRAGYFSDVVSSDRVRAVAEPVNPWSLLDAVDTIYTVSSGLGFEAALAGKSVVCFGSPFYAGWGFTDDRRLALQRPRSASAIELFAACYLRYARYFDSYSRKEIAFEAAIEQLAWRRDRFMARERRAVCYRIARWKRSSLNRMLDGVAGRPLHVRSVAGAIDAAKQGRAEVVAWASRDSRGLAEACAEAGVPFARAEDGFVRSAGLGASFVLPLSLVFDERGIYYDSRAPSDLEWLLQNADFPVAVLERARRLCEKLVATGTTKYNVSARQEDRIDSGGRPIILVPGQVEDDASIEKGSPRIKRNLDLLQAVRERHPDGFLVYKPHPDVEAGFRRGRVAPETLAALADKVIANASIAALIAMADRVETITSLAGFEALIRGRPVTTHGQPFYSGWGLTEDLCPVPRRTRQLTLDSLVAASLILYPKYIHPGTGLLCTPEILVEHLASADRRRPTGAARVLRLAQVSVARALHIGHSMKLLARRGA